jgi:hypothetical protein
MSSDSRSILLALITAIITYPVVEILRGVNGKRIAVMEYRRNQLNLARRYMNETEEGHDVWELDADNFRKNFNVLFIKKYLSHADRKKISDLKTGKNWKSEPSDADVLEHREAFHQIINLMIAKIAELEHRWLLNGFFSGFSRRFIRN